MLRRNAFFFANAIIIVLILTVYFAIQSSEIAFYRQMAESQAADDVKLTAIDISSSLSNIVTEQRVVSQMMANDMFLKDWCHQEDGSTSGQQVYQLYSYLQEYKNKYGYDVVFFVSDATKNYYYDQGFNKVVDENDDFDSWYFNFLALHQQYDIQIDHDEVNNNQVSMFVNCLVQDKGFKTLGVVGVGRNINGFQRKLAQFEKDYGVKIRLVNVGNAHNSFTGGSGYYSTPADAAIEFGLTEDEICSDVGDEGKVWFDGDKCINIRNNADLNWNIIVQKDMKATIDNIMERVSRRITLIFLFILVYAIVSFSLMRRLNFLSRKHENTDDLTGLYNNKIFREGFERDRKSRRRRKKRGETSLFMLDVDDFKIFNDNFGHLYGNTILKLVADSLSTAVGKNGIVARWGGDEFIGVVYGSEQVTSQLINDVMDKISNENTHKSVTLSAGVVKVDYELNLDKNMNRADEALYASKENGKGQCTVYSEMKKA